MSNQIKKQITKFIKENYENVKIIDTGTELRLINLVPKHLTLKKYIEKYNNGEMKRNDLFQFENHKQANFLIEELDLVDKNNEKLENYKIKEVQQRGFKFKNKTFYYFKDFLNEMFKEFGTDIDFLPITNVYLLNAIKKEITKRLDNNSDRIILKISNKQTFEQIKKDFPSLIKTEWNDKIINN